MSSQQPALPIKVVAAQTGAVFTLNVNTSVPLASSVSQSVYVYKGTRAFQALVGPLIYPAAPFPICEMPNTARHLEIMFFLKSLSGTADGSVLDTL